RRYLHPHRRRGVARPPGRCSGPDASWRRTPNSRDVSWLGVLALLDGVGVHRADGAGCGLLLNRGTQGRRRADGAGPQQDVPGIVGAVDHGGLAAGHALHGLPHLQLQAPRQLVGLLHATRRSDRCWVVNQPGAGRNHPAMGAHLHFAVEFAALHLRVEALEAIGDDPADPQVLPGADGHGARVGVDIRDIAWAAVQGFARQAKALALTNGETVHAVVLRHGLPAGIPHQAGTQADLRAQECLSSAIRDEADVVAIWLIGDPEAGVGGLLADLGLDRVPDREHTVCQLFV